MDAALVMYRRQHRHPVNRAIHVVCIPVIIWTVSLFLAAVHISHFMKANSLAAIVYTSMCFHHNPKTLVPMASFFALVVASNHWALHHVDDVYRKALAFHVLAWFAQFVGHYGFERNRPALFDSLAQSVVAAPLLVYDEVLGDHEL